MVENTVKTDVFKNRYAAVRRAMARRPGRVVCPGDCR